MDSSVDGLAVINGGGMYHYVGCGLDYVWLKDGFDYRDTTRGRLVRIHDRDGLHAAIARWVVSNPARIRGQEVRFLRSMLGLSQDGLGKLLNQTRVNIARWELARNKAIPAATDKWLRIVYTKRSEGDQAVCKLVDLLIGLDELQNGSDSQQRQARFSDDRQEGWRESRNHHLQPDARL